MDRSPDELTAEVTLDGDRTAVVRVAGEIDIATSQHLTRAIHDAVGRGAEGLILDMSAVTFMDSSGIAALIASRSTATVVLRSPSDAVLRLLATTGLSDTFTLEP